jgi:hypothetical protein
VALPLPDAPEVSVIHPALLVAVHAQPVAAVTVIVPEFATSETLFDVGEIVGAHGAPACVTVNVLPPTVRVPVRWLVVGFAVRLYVTEPLPLPFAPAVTVIQPALLVAVQPQPVAAVTVIVPVPAASDGFAEVGAMVGEQGAPACVTVKVLPAIVRVPVRELVLGFAVTL